MSPRYNLINNSLNDLDRSLYIVSSTTTTTTYKHKTRYPPILILTISSLRSNTSTADELQLNPDFKLYSLDIR